MVPYLMTCKSKHENREDFKDRHSMRVSTGIDTLTPHSDFVIIWREGSDNGMPYSHGVFFTNTFISISYNVHTRVQGVDIHSK